MMSIIQQISANEFEQINVSFLAILVIVSIAVPIHRFVKSVNVHLFLRSLRISFMIDSIACLIVTTSSFLISYLVLDSEKSFERLIKFCLPSSLYLILSVTFLTSSIFLDVIMRPRRRY